MTSQYEPISIEEKWVAKWDAAKVGFGDPSSAKPKFSMIMPPPNVTGSLHLGHTMMAAVEDTVVRYKKMTGHEVCWVPGIDHAGIATQSVVERHLARDNISRHDLGRDEFLDRVWQWKNEKGGRILYQLHRLGCAADWDKEAFTMSPALSKAVAEAFVTLHERGLIYRDVRLVSWCSFLKTALSEIEVDAEEFEKPDRIRIPGYDKTVEVGTLWQFKYPLKRSVRLSYPCGSAAPCGGDAHACGTPKIECDEWIEVATSRPETMLGDVAVAVNPNDERYKHLVGEELYHPFIPERKITVVADDHCDPEFGTGAVKITPAHDKNDYEVGQRHNLPNITVFTLDGKINSLGGKAFEGMHRFQARVEIEKQLEEMGLFVSKFKNPKKMAIPRCSRSGDVIEYMLLPQWYVRCEGMAARAAQACRDGELKILPEGSDKQWFYWLDNIRDWCVSRQLWWGHRIPAYRISHPAVKESEEWVVARDEEEAMQKAKALLTQKYQVSFNECKDTDCLQLDRDEDVLDTWFSSGLFPFSVFGWPDESTPELKKFFPTDLMETGSDIIFFWVARMVMFSLELMDELPFKEVFLHPMVRDSHGKKMSKSSGNVLDPVDVIHGITLEKMNEMVLSSNIKESEVKRALDAQKKDFPNGIEQCGTDALRYGLLAYLKGGRSVNLDIQRVVSYRHFCNKIFNALKFTLMSLKNFTNTAEFLEQKSSEHWADKWITHRLNEACKATNEGLTTYQFYEAVNATYSFILYDFCDIYLEMSKPRLAEQSIDCARTLFQTFDVLLRLIHPLMPFVSEECWDILYAECKLDKPQPFLMLADYPAFKSEASHPAADVEVNQMMNVIRAFRSMLSQFEVPPKQKLSAFIKVGSSQAHLEDKLSSITTLAKLANCQIVDEVSKSHVVDVACDGDVIVCLDPAGAIDFKKVVAKLSKKQAQLEKALEGVHKKMSMADYDTKVPQDVKEKNSEALSSYQTELSQLKSAIQSAEAFLSF